MSTNRKKKKFPTEFKLYLIQVMREADAKRKYRWAINIFEKYLREFDVDTNMKYRLGLLYDHLAIFKHRKKRNDRQKKLFNYYLKKSEEIYKYVIKENSASALGHLGLARVYYFLGQERKSNYFSKKAHKLNFQLPKDKRGSLGIGGFFLDAGDFKKAEAWFKKELKDLGENDLGVNVNLVIFYDVTKQYKKAIPYVLKSEKLIKKEISRKNYKNFNKVETNKTLSAIQSRINRIKKKTEVK